MFLQDLIAAREAADKPVRVALIGAGKFGSMFLAQAPTTRGLVVDSIFDLSPDRARAACAAVGWSDAMIDALRFSDDLDGDLRAGDVDVVVEATGDPAAGVAHARKAFALGAHVVLANVEADVLAGPALAQDAAAAGVVCAMAYGDQPALICELVEWAEACGLQVVAAGKGTRYLPSYHDSTPDTVWTHYGLTPQDAQDAGMNAKMFNSFLDGTKSAIEMAAVANATNLACPEDGLAFPSIGAEDLAAAFAADDLLKEGRVEVVSSLARDGSPVPRDLRWGVYAVFAAPNAYTAACFRQYGMATDPSGRFGALYRPYHLIGLELNVSIFAAALRGQATGRTRRFAGDVMAVAKRDLAAGETLDGEGGETVWGKLAPAALAAAKDALPIGLAHRIALTAPVKRGTPVRWADVAIDRTAPAAAARLSMTPGDAL